MKLSDSFSFREEILALYAGISVTMQKAALLLILLFISPSCYSRAYRFPAADPIAADVQTPWGIDSEEPGQEARSWLIDNPNPYAFASNRFASNLAALEFVELLYESGAVMVYVEDIRADPARIQLEGGPYADTLRVQLPDNAQQRKKIFEIAKVEARREGFRPERDTGQHFLLFWWD